MRTALLGLPALVLFQANPVSAQHVVIRNAEPSAVVEDLRILLSPQGFTLASSNDNEALFTRPGTVGNPATFFDQVVIQLTIHFRKKADRLSVTANEESVTKHNDVVQTSHPFDMHREQLQQLLDYVRVYIESAQQPEDSAKKPDSTE